MEQAQRQTEEQRAEAVTRAEALAAENHTLSAELASLRQEREQEKENERQQRVDIGGAREALGTKAAELQAALAAQRGALDAERARAQSLEEGNTALQDASRQHAQHLLRGKKQLEAANAEVARLKAQNDALQAEVSRLSMERRSAVNPPPASSSNGALSGGQVGGGQVQFSEFVALRRENERLKQQLEATKTSQGRTLQLTKQLQVGVGASSKAGHRSHKRR